MTCDIVRGYTLTVKRFMGVCGVGEPRVSSLLHVPADALATPHAVHGNKKQFNISRRSHLVKLFLHIFTLYLGVVSGESHMLHFNDRFHTN